MFTVSHQYNRWRILKETDIVLSGIGTIEAAWRIASCYGIVLSGINQATLRAA